MAQSAHGEQVATICEIARGYYLRGAAAFGLGLHTFQPAPAKVCDRSVIGPKIYGTESRPVGTGNKLAMHAMRCFRGCCPSRLLGSEKITFIVFVETIGDKILRAVERLRAAAGRSRLRRFQFHAPRKIRNYMPINLHHAGKRYIAAARLLMIISTRYRVFSVIRVIGPARLSARHLMS